MGSFCKYRLLKVFSAALLLILFEAPRDIFVYADNDDSPLSGTASREKSSAERVSASGENPSPYSLKVSVKVVNLFVTVVDKSGRVVQNLGKEDFMLWEDNIEQTISSFATSRQTALSLAILLDLSGSMSEMGKFTDAISIITALVESLHENDEVSLYSFSELLVRTRVPFTRDHKQIMKKLAMLRPGGDTALYQALSFMPQILGKPKNRCAVILLTDGIDNKSIVSLDKAVEIARNMEAPIYTICFSPERNASSKNEAEYASVETLRTIAGDTGGSCTLLPARDFLPPIIKGIMEELRFQYFLGYRSNQRSLPGTYHRIDLAVSNRDYAVRARKGYYVSE